MKHSFSGILPLAFDSLRSNRLRTCLTAAIIAVGITSLVGIETSLDILSSRLSESLAAQGGSSFSIISADMSVCRPLCRREAELFASRWKFSAVSVQTVVSSSAIASFDGRRTDPTLTLVSSDVNFLASSGYDIGIGRNFTPYESENNSPVCLIGDAVRKKLFRDESPLGKTITAEDRMLRVVGVLDRQGGIIGSGADLTVVFTGGDEAAASIVTVMPTSGGNVESLVEEATLLMRSVRRLRAGQENDFIISTSDAYASRLESIQGKLSAAALAIGLITMLGAAISLMNVMLVGVKERVKEIGLRKALGETRSSISRQFMAEAVLIGQVGGGVGIMLGILAGNLVAVSLDSPLTIPWGWIVKALMISLTVSLVSGTMPARKAAALSPVDALRSE